MDIPEAERQLILTVPAAIERLLHVDEDINLFADIDYSWEDVTVT